jgi:hypothetical protein
MYHYILKINSRENNYAITTNPIQVSYNNTGNSSLIQRITIKGASIPNVFYNVNSTNNVLKFQVDFTDNIFTWPVGNYNMTSFLAAFNNSLGAILGVSFNLNPLTNKLELKSVNFIVILLSVGSTCFKLLGLRTTENFNSTELAPNVNPLTFMPDLSGIRNIYAETSFSNMNCLDSKGYKSYGAFIPVDQPFGSIIHYINQEQDLNDIIRSKTYSQNLNKIEIALRDVEGNLLDLQNMNWEITFKIVLAHEHDLVDN